MVSVIIPTMNRLQIAECVQKIADTTPGLEVEVVLEFDGTDENLAAFKEYSRNNLVRYWPRLTVMWNKKDHRRGAIQCWNDGLARCHGEYIVFANDDSWWGDDWLGKALECHYKCLDGHGMVGFNDEHNDGNVLATHYLADREFVKRILGGRIAFPLFNFYCNDTVANILAKKAGLFKWCPECIVTHNHYTTGRRERDALDFENEPKLNVDISILEEWIQRGAKIEWSSLI